MPGVSPVEAEELLDIVAARLRTELQYELGDADDPPAPERYRSLRTLVRNVDGVRRIVKLGYRNFRSQPVHLWIAGRAALADGAPGANPDLAEVDKYLAQAGELRQGHLATLTAADLAMDRIKLSFVQPDRCLTMLTMFGFTVTVAGEKVDTNALPVVVHMPSTDQHVLLAGKDASFPPTEADPIDELLVFYDPARPEQFAHVRDRIKQVIDVPAARIVIEAMVLEIAEAGLERLGVRWELEAPQRNLEALTIGRLPSFATQADDEVPTLDAELKNIFGEFRVQIEALVRDGDAEVLSRPNVTTIDNRMARINVGRIIPVVTSIQNPKAEIVTVNFKDVSTGITLNVQPRVSDDRTQISMQVVATVRARVPNEDVVITDTSGNEVARSPTISEREVKTYTRIPNNTPFIIGGLISRDDLNEFDKVPMLGDIPYLGPLLFQTKREQSLKREVIIVITPRLLPEENVANAAMPEDKDKFDTIDHALVRDAYRIRAEDVFDLTFLYENTQLLKMQRLADQVARRNQQLAARYPVKRFAGGRLPGEQVLVYRQIYEVIKRKGLDKRVTPERVLFFAPDEASETGFRPRSVRAFLAEHLGITARRDFVIRREIRERLEGKALAMIFTIQRYVADPRDILAQPAPRIEVFDCPNESIYTRLLWQYNQPDDEGKQRYTILLRDEKDLTRLRRALVLKRTVALNVGRQALTLKNFSLGRLLLIPTIKPEQGHIVDDETAKYFFYTEQYYPAVRQYLTTDLEAMRNFLQLPEVRRYLDDPDAVLRPVAAEPE